MVVGATVKDQLSTAKFFADNTGIQELKSAKHRNSAKALKEAAKQFEAMFFQMILKNMRDANNVLKSDLVNNDKTEFYEDMYHQQLAQTLSESEHLGLAKVLM